MDYQERRSHARSVYPKQDTSRMWTVRVKQEEEEDMKERGHYEGGVPNKA